MPIILVGGKGKPAMYIQYHIMLSSALPTQLPGVVILTIFDGLFAIYNINAIEFQQWSTLYI